MPSISRMEKVVGISPFFCGSIAYRPGKVNKAGNAVENLRGGGIFPFRPAGFVVYYTIRRRLLPFAADMDGFSAEKEAF